jgi:hypothetical protein
MKKDEDDNGCCTRVGNEELLTIDVALGQRNEELMTRDIVSQWVDNKGGEKNNMEWRRRWLMARNDEMGRTHDCEDLGFYLPAP